MEEVGCHASAAEREGGAPPARLQGFDGYGRCGAAAGRLRRERTTVEIHKASCGSALRKRRLATAAAAMEPAPHALVSLDRMRKSCARMTAARSWRRPGRSGSCSPSFEATWVLTNIILRTSENIKVVVNHNAVPFFVNLLGSPTDEIIEQAVLALGNMAGDSPLFGDMVHSFHYCSCSMDIHNSQF